MNTLGSWAIDRSYGAGRPLWPDRPVRMVVAPVLPLIRVALDTLHCLNVGHVRIGACLASCQGISRTQSEGGDCSK
jgi:hypothetical protein